MKSFTMRPTQKTDPSQAVPKEARQGSVQEGAYGFRFLLTLTLLGMMGNPAELGCQTTSDFAASCTALHYSSIHAFNTRPSLGLSTTE
jgi:hypothetical protein